MDLTFVSAIAAGQASDNRIADWADQHTPAFEVSEALHHPALAELAESDPGAVLNEGQGQGIALLFALAPARVLLPLCRHAVLDQDLLNHLIEQTAICLPLADRGLAEALAQRGARRLSSLLTLSTLSDLYRVTEPLLAQLAEEIPVTFPTFPHALA